MRKERKQGQLKCTLITFKKRGYSNMFGIPMKHLGRYHEILSVLVRHGLGCFFLPFYGQMENLELIGAHLREAFTELGPTFVKVGQLASTRSDVLPRAIVLELAKLQDQVRPLSFGNVRQVIEGALQARLESVFLEFDPKPLAAASIGQVHQAVLNNGERVGVKVQRPNIREVVKTDLEIFGTLVTLIEQKTDWGTRFPLRMLLREFSKTILEELDFLNEGRNAEKLAQFNKKNKSILIPKIYWEFSRSTVLTLEYFPGMPLSQILESSNSVHDALAYNPHQIADRLSQGLLKQIFLDGCFHGDPHPGNVLIMPEGKIALVDFGITGTLTPVMRHQLAALFIALARGKDDLILNTISQMGIVPKDIDRLSFRKDIAALRENLKASSGKIVIGESIQNFFNIVFRYGIYIPSEFVLIGKSFLTLEGVLNKLDSTFSLVEYAKPFSRRLLWEKYSPKNLLNRISGDRKLVQPGSMER